MVEDAGYPIETFVQDVELDTIKFYEERARANVETPEDVDTDQPFMTFGLGVNNDRTRFEFRFRLVLNDREESAEYVVDAAARYHCEQTVPVSDEVLTDFAGRVAFMATYPYLRASVQASATRLGKPAPVLGIVRAGDFGPGETMTPEEIDKSFNDRKAEV